MWQGSSKGPIAESELTKSVDWAKKRAGAPVTVARKMIDEVTERVTEECKRNTKKPWVAPEECSKKWRLWQRVEKYSAKGRDEDASFLADHFPSDLVTDACPGGWCRRVAEDTDGDEHPLQTKSARHTSPEPPAKCPQPKMAEVVASG